MARWTGCFGSRRQDQGARPGCDAPASAGEPVFAAEWQLSGGNAGACPQREERAG